MATGADAVVIGAGAAGSAAARTLHDADRDVLLIEASSRLGGRAHTVVVDGMALDLGCTWLHSGERNPWVAIGEARGFTIDRTPKSWNRQWRDLGYPPAEQAAFDAAYHAWNGRALAAVEGPDRPLSDFIAPDDCWTPRIDAISGFVNGAGLRDVSLHDWAAYETASSDRNWRVRKGYGALVVDHAAGLDVRFAAPALHIDHRARTLRIETPAGTIETAAAIVCVPTPHLAEGALTFDPPLPAKAEAAAALPLGLANKIMLGIAGKDYPHDAQLIGNPYGAETASYQVGRFGRPVVEGFVGGDCAEALERGGDGAAADFAIGELVALLGGDWRSRLRPLVASRWRHDPFVKGGYSHAKVGCAPMRQVLAEPVDGRLFFAGEACSATDFSTAHGAYATGVAAARALIG